MKKLILLITLLASFSILAEHDAIYCGKMLSAESGKSYYSRRSPEAILAVEFRIEDGDYDFWDHGYAGVVGLNDKQLAFVERAVRGSEKNGTNFCIKARWGGAAYSSWDIGAITLLSDNIHRIDYMSSFLRK
jgi:hypothetical protein